MIQVNHLSFSYPGSQTPTLHDLNFHIRAGEIFGFLGPSGSGKSTTQKILFRLLQGYQGSARIAEREVRDWDQQLYERIGVGFELPNHYLKLSALENLEFFAGFYRRPLYLPLLDLLALVGLERDAHKRVADFSKGMRMRLNFARALMHDPDMLFLDEPTSGLDPVNARIVKDIILDWKRRGKTIFLTTHQMHDADELCDTVAFLVNGQIRALDSPQQLKLQHSRSRVVVQYGEAQPPEMQQFALEDLGQNTDFLQLLQTQRIRSIHSQEASLDDIFIQITGQKLDASALES